MEKLTSAICRSRPPIGGINNRPARPGASVLTNAIYLPSGDHVGENSSAGFVVTRTESSEPIVLR
jgi:hypothetical protein